MEDVLTIVCLFAYFVFGFFVAYNFQGDKLKEGLEKGKMFFISDSLIFLSLMISYGFLLILISALFFGIMVVDLCRKAIKEFVSLFDDIDDSALDYDYYSRLPHDDFF